METETVTPINDTVAVLCATSDQGLLDTFAALTHRIHAARASYASLPDGCEAGEVADLRAQRDMVRAELLRRMGGE